MAVAAVERATIAGMLRDVEACPAREQLRDLLGDQVVDGLSDRALGRLLGMLFASARREVERAHMHDDQMALDAA